MMLMMQDICILTNSKFNSTTQTIHTPFEGVRVRVRVSMVSIIYGVYDKKENILLHHEY